MVVGLSREKHLILRGSARLHPKRPRDVRLGDMVRHAQFLPGGAVGVLRHAAVGELNADGVVETVVALVRYPSIAHEGARAVVNIQNARRV